VTEEDNYGKIKAFTALQMSSTAELFFMKEEAP
jgi:hypothetical protein